MNTRFCQKCKSEKNIDSSNRSDNQAISILSCGHKFIEISLQDTIKLGEEIQLKKKGETIEKYRKGDKPPNINYTCKFIEYGDIDYEAASVLFNIQNRDYDFMNQAAFLCAQAIEKYLKAFLIFKSPQHYPNLSHPKILIEFKKLSHNLIKILNECIKDDIDLSKFKSQIKNIIKFSLLKYPDVEDEMIYSSEGLSISSEILRDVKQIGDFIKGKIV
ncbi:hypothetical protein A2334_03530 [Candidatus Roizmanbacteria bacterium RIFOXYB2_FULL_38_10]|uniref:HEPN domain-containing protein n=1 Tax=Candidatus Roizmanbacteria bacterium RIFOXYD1_FULL_38_12 TaxID=1802093 RepID=A0A1F7L0Y4_9BACT|nr:MAG: hypothetical protein A3K47_03315 [Candidatus Roizmanbacteria bacterium RIFOXYA2_FULL_38_14]OGK63794.1 MAG: hypothetical protein A3K27_03315 [Candidatus Roizmanbacteria bacterium RIFOXYA1_FULL_37_12]OGK65640.1 MAG: hypothetical protein A3K38_03315 [Candidatus Roizmanbacteria bacterium RIFOXYB1_FULL_40_23]OGK67472.1 MAG: hypothetical protein A2334_03530 [Candidatus Roizmanbacteria bacterium RIFOXYB2_FULL_38_10]OGK70045.1 MAG: hypothetical protein A3K21_03320 [Candidatus Roizmanbacteria ba